MEIIYSTHDNERVSTTVHLVSNNTMHGVNLADNIEHMEGGNISLGTTHLRITRLFRLTRCLAWNCSCGFGFARLGLFAAIDILGCVSPELTDLQGVHQW